jgi:hypothetical protein
MNAFMCRFIACLLAALPCTLGLAPAGAVTTPEPAQHIYAPRLGAPRSRASDPHLDYYGGRVLGHVKVDIVVWDRWSYGRSAHLTGSRSVESFLKAVTASPYVDWLDEYDTPSQHIGRGGVEGVYTVHAPAADDGATITSNEIDDALRSLIAGQQLPKPGTTRLYAIFFPSRKTISTPDGDSVSDFCAYHDTTTSGRSTVYYAVMPYEVSNRGCKMASTWFDSLTTVVSHELLEAITDPGVGLHRVAWYDRDNGEIADICAFTSSPARIVGADGVSYTVQRAWSNRRSMCVAGP